MLDEYKELCRLSAERIPKWERMTKNELCRAYVANKGNSEIQDAYLGAILYSYWGLISKYYYLSSNCATPEDCYEWLVDSVLCCLNTASWEDPNGSIYKDPNGPDKVINRCMKCARLTYYQFINRKKRRDDFGLLSIDELQELFGTTVSEPKDESQEVKVSTLYIKEYVVKTFHEKNYFVSFMIDCILSDSVFDIVKDNVEYTWHPELNVRKLCKSILKLDESYLQEFSNTYQLDLQEVTRAFQYVKMVPQASLKKKILQAIDTLKHSKFGMLLKEGV